MGLFRKTTPRPAFNPVPVSGYSAGVELQVGPYAPLATPNVQGGAFARPYGVPSQLAGVYPGAQLYCGVEAIDRGWEVLTAADVPYFQQTPRSQPVVTTRDGGRYGGTFGPAEMARTYGPIRIARANQAQAFATSLLGW